MNNKLSQLVGSVILSLVFFLTIFSLVPPGHSESTGLTQVHVWAGGLTLLGSAAHLIKNRGWMRAVFSRPGRELSATTRRNRTVDTGMASAGFICAISGVLFMVLGVHALGHIHAVSGVAFILLVGMHLLLHWNWLKNALTSISGLKQKRDAA